MLVIAAFLSFIIGVIHSYLGERYILIRLFRRDNIPVLFGSDSFTKRTIRFAWHLTTIAWVGFSVILISISTDQPDLKYLVLKIVGSVFLVSGIFSFGFTKGKHLSWLFFWTIAAICYFAGQAG